LSGVLAVRAVGSTVSPVVAAVVALVLLAALGGILSLGVNSLVAVVVDSGRTSSTNNTAATLAGTGVDFESVGVSSGDRAEVATGRQDARAVREVVAVGDASGSVVEKRSLGQPAARGLNFDFIGHLITTVLDARNAIEVLLAAGGFAADTGVDVVAEISDARRVSRAIGAINELVQRATAVAKRQGSVIRALSSVVELKGALGSGTSATFASNALTLAIGDVATLGGLAALEGRKAGFLVNGAAFVVGLAAHSSKEVRRRQVTRLNHARGERSGWCVATAEDFRPAALQVVADQVACLEGLGWECNPGLGDHRVGGDTEY